jgi:hypothetical protein
MRNSVLNCRTEVVLYVVGPDTINIMVRIRTIRKFSDLPDPFVRGTDPDPSIIKQSSKKNIDFYCFCVFIVAFCL